MRGKGGRVGKVDMGKGKREGQKEGRKKRTGNRGVHEKLQMGRKARGKRGRTGDDRDGKWKAGEREKKGKGGS